MRWSLVFLVEGITVMVFGFVLGLLPLYMLLAIFVLVFSLHVEFDANVEARDAWLRKTEIRRAELY